MSDFDPWVSRTWWLHADDPIVLDARTVHATGPGTLGCTFRRMSLVAAPG